MSFEVNRSSILPFSTSQMYRLVCDVENYPHFLEWCKHSRVIEQGVDFMVAELGVDYGGLKISFTTLNNLVEDHSIELTLKRGPFKALTGIWKFEALSDTASKVSLAMSFRFSNPIMNRFLGRTFIKLVSEQLSAFELRAKELYG